MPRCLFCAITLLALLPALPVRADAPIAETWDYVAAMRKVAEKFRGKPGIVLHIGDSITYANPYGQWARNGAGQTPQQQAVLKWMHTGDNNDNDGWFLCRFDHPAGGRSYTACGGIRADEMLQGGKQQLPPLADLLAKYRPQMVVVLLGTNDASAGRETKAYIGDMSRIADAILKQNAIPILTTIPPHIGREELAKDYNVALRELAKSKQLPLIDYEAEILGRRPNDWNGTLLSKDDVHPSATFGGTTPTSAPTEENLRNSGYLLRGWLTVEKIREVKAQVIDGKPRADAPPKADDPAAASTGRPMPRPLPAGEVVKVPVTRDTWFSQVGQEADCNLGGSPRLKLKSNQELSLIDIDASPLKGRVILGATLHVRVAGNEVLRRVSVSSFASEWNEGTAPSYMPQPGSSSFKSRAHPQVPWAWPGSDLTAVTLGNGHTQWWMADAFPPDDDGWQKLAIEPALLAARVAGVSHGFLLFDDTGSEWTREGEKFTAKHMPNRFLYSHDSGPQNAPYFTVVLGTADSSPPGPCGDLRIDPSTASLPAGEADVSWTTPPDAGSAGTVGFLVEIDGKPAPRYLAPMAGPAGQRVTLKLRDLGLAAGTTVDLRNRAVDGAGNIGPPVTLRVKTSVLVAGTLPGIRPEPPRPGAELPRLGAAEVAILDPLDKVQPLTGAIVPLQSPAYLSGNHLWSARDPAIQLHAARNEFVGFQVLFRGPVAGLAPSLAFGGIKPAISFGEYRHVSTPKGPFPDPIVPLKGTFRVPNPADNLAGIRSGSLLCEVYVPHNSPAGVHKGTLTLTAGESQLSIPVTLTVWDFALPDSLGFLPEMNCYGLPENERDYYRLAHRHRTVLNCVPYSQRGEVSDGWAPKWDGQSLDWTAWDQRFGPYFDGTAFEDLPRKSVPLECFYLPLHENWPLPVDGHYSGSYWADEAFSPEYRKTFTAVVEEFAAHLKKKNWDRTLFHAFLNNKVDYKSRGWSRASSPWLLDEPANFQDYWALRFFGEAVHAGLSGSGPKPIVFRADISRPQWQRDSLDAVLDYNVVAGGPFRQYRRLVLDRKERFGQIVVDYGSSNAIDESNVQPAAWCVDSWTLGSDGVLPWQTVGTANSWKTADSLSLFYPGGFVDQEEPIPSIRLKAYLRGQQDTEYYSLLARVLGRPRWVVAEQVRQALKLSAKVRGTGFTGGEDAGLVEYTQLRPAHLWSVRVQIGQVLNERRAGSLRPAADWKPQPRNRATLGNYVTVGDVPAASLATVSSTRGQLPRKVAALQGRAVVRDALIDPQMPDEKFGHENRDNRLSRRDDVCAFLMRFDLDAAKLPPNAKVTKATLTVWVWDPSSKGKTKVAARPVITLWDEPTVTWRVPAPGQSWKGPAGFALDDDCGPPGPPIIVLPDAGDDLADPPIAYQFDVTASVKSWTSGAPNHGLALSPIIDRQVDAGQFTRFQVLASEYEEAKYTPRLTIEWE